MTLPLAVAVASLVAALACAGRFAIDPDELEHLHAAWLWAHGVAPYSGFFCNHPPGYWLLLRPVIAFSGGHDLVALLQRARFVSWLIAAGTVAATFAFVRTLMGRAAAGWGAAFVAAYAAVAERVLQVRPDLAALLPLLAGSTLALEGVGLSAGGAAPAAAWTFAGGVLLGVAVTVSTKALFWTVIVLGAAAVHTLGGARGTGARPGLARLALLAAGVALPLVALAAWLASRHALAAFWADTVSANAALAGSSLRRAELIHRVASELFAWPMIGVPLAIAGLAATFAGGGHAPRARGTTLVLLVLAGAVLIALGNGPWAQYHIPLLVLLGGLAGGGMAMLVTACPAPTRGAVRVATAGMLIAWVLVLGLFRTGGSDVALRRSLAAFQRVVDVSEPTDTYVGLTQWNPVYVMDADPSTFLGLVVNADRPNAERLAEVIERRRPRWVIGCNAPFWTAGGSLHSIQVANLPVVRDGYRPLDRDSMLMERITP